MNISRRFFIGGAASFGAFGGCRFLSCHDYRAGGTPNLRFGVVSDIHITDSDPLGKDAIYGSNATFRKTLQWFRDQNVDAVMIAGDMADKGMDTHLEAVAEAWYSVFPGDRYPDGRPIEKVETKTRGGKSKDGKTVIPSETKTAYRVTAPAVLQTKKSRLYDLVFVAESKTGEKKTKLVMAEGYNHALGHPRTKLSNFCLFALDELPKGDIRFTVTPRNCFARSGQSLSSNLQPPTSNL